MKAGSLSGLIAAVVTVLAWGSWMAPTQKMSAPNPIVITFYVALMTVATSALVAISLGQLSFRAFAGPFLGGVIWTVSTQCAFQAVARIGLARAPGIWAPLSIIVSLLWGIILFEEFLDLGLLQILSLGISTIVILSGIYLILLARGSGHKQRTSWDLIIGVGLSLCAGVLWGSYFIPIKWQSDSLWMSVFPMSLGILAGSVATIIVTRTTVRLTSATDYFLVCSSGFLWSVGNYGMLVLVDELGAGRGFTISQIGLAVNALLGIFWLKDPPPRSRAAVMTFLGCLLVILGGIALGNIG